jgi:hypothetical protein
MKYFSKLTFTLFAVVAIFSSCCHTIDCMPAYINSFTFVSYDSSAIAAAILRRFPKGSNFKTIQDSVLLENYLNDRYQQGDTTIIQTYVDNNNPNGHPPAVLYTGYDYEVFVPSTNTLIKIDKLIEHKQTREACYGDPDGGPQTCNNLVSSFSVNGQPYDVQNNYQTIYITK